MLVEHFAGPLGAACQRAFQQHPVLLGCDLAAKHDRHHLVAQVLVENTAIEIEQGLGAAGLDQGLVELAVIALPELRPPWSPAIIRRSMKASL